jgi:hypothetical protein
MSDILLISAPPTGFGGLFSMHEGDVSMIDPLACSGLAMSNGYLYRLFSCERQGRPSSDLVVYDSDGPYRVHRLDGVGQAHDVAVLGDDALVVDTARNAVCAVKPNGGTSIWWQANRAHDSWHLNCLLVDNGELYATVFGKHITSFGWSDQIDAAHGLLVRLPSGEPIVRGLTHPHHPRRFDGMWVVCNSLRGQLVAFDDRGVLVRQRELEGYIRGITVDDRFIYVGQSFRRQTVSKIGFARVTVLERKDWRPVDTFPVPVHEIYDLLLVPPSLASAVSNGAWLKALKGSPENPSDRWLIGEPLSAFDMRAVIEINAPRQAVCNSTFRLPCRVTNLGKGLFSSAPPYPIELVYVWRAPDGQVLRKRGVRCELPRQLAPGETLATEMLIATPSEAGHFRLAVTLVQTGISSFENSDARNVAHTVVEIIQAEDPK